ncbi:hypothetical protein K435DRAFT_793143 [Dendrothele bispora CBS 962.96]|uniref:Uncharacterized protein n=1 Tax=Dendrothele bispora (strain CBS 962.96) TaxID=1314807 RepID=A0A4S8MG79_DENBC|nr:hypothetical protein K435DRAFT_793143 [Dendrothele bispora CBS 962.96]
MLSTLVEDMLSTLVEDMLSTLVEDMLSTLASRASNYVPDCTRTSQGSTAALQSVTPGELLDLANGTHNGPSEEDFRLDLPSEGVWSSWNQAATDVFAAYILKQEGYKKDARISTRTLKNSYDKPPKTPHFKRKSTHSKDTGDRRNQRVRRTFERRMNVIDIFYDRYGHDMAGINDAKKYLTRDIMSGEESCDEGVLTTNLPWRSRELGDFLHHCSNLHLAVKYNKYSQYTNGAFPLRRIPSDKLDRREEAPHGLPTNFYDQAWLNDPRQPTRRVSLRTRPSVDLTLPAEVLSLAERFENVHTRTDIPKPAGAV